LGIGFGYTGFIIAEEAKNGGSDGKTAIPISNPLFSGIDLHVNFTGVDNLNVTFNNNISFVGAKGLKDNGVATKTDKIVNGIKGEGPTPDSDNYSETLIVYTGGINATYALTDNLSASLQVADSVYVLSDKGEDSVENSSTYNVFRLALSAEYKVGFASFGGGLSLDMPSYTNKAKDSAGTGTNTHSVTTFGIPLYFKVAF
jgi:hypothetical protein